MTQKNNDKWMTPSLKASWFEDGEEPAENALKPDTLPPVLLAAEHMTVSDFFDLLVTGDEPPTG